MDSVFHVGLDLVLLSPSLLTHPPEKLDFDLFPFEFTICASVCYVKVCFIPFKSQFLENWVIVSKHRVVSLSFRRKS